ncbi:MAG: MBL fold metallo-hydrolase [Firmicutes bacterium]|nr:MBL fold metallo-hydrolase [Bacillota bacterium]
MKNRQAVLDALASFGVAYTLYEHAPVHTVQDCHTVRGIDWTRTELVRNAFLCNRQRTSFYLMLLRHDVPFRTAVVSKALGVSRLSFGPEEMLPELLGLSAGAVSPLGLLFDSGKRVTLVVDEGLARYDMLAFHPCDNTATVVLAGKDFFEVFLRKLGRAPVWVEAKERVHSMKIQWLGHACFRLVYDGYAIVLDPYADGAVEGLGPLDVTANAVFCSHEHDDHGAVKAVRLVDTGRPSPFIVTEIAAFHDDQGGALRGANTIRVLEAGGVRALHLGDLGHMLTREQIEQIGRVDAVMVPVGGYYTIGAKTADEVARALGAAVVIPMHYRPEQFGFSVLDTLDSFLALRDDVRRYDSDTIEITPDTQKQTAVLAHP